MKPIHIGRIRPKAPGPVALTLMCMILVMFLLISNSIVAGGRDEKETVEESDQTGESTPLRTIDTELDDEATQIARERMVSRQIESRGIIDPSVLEAMRRVPRHLFMPKQVQNLAYEDHAVPIGEGQTISQPYIVALMTETLELDPEDRVLEIGTGSGYQAAVLAEVVAEVYTIEIKEVLHKSSTETLSSLGYHEVETKHDDGYFGWEEHAPFDAIMITAAVNHVPPPLLDQLKDGGKIILPLGDPFHYQELVLVTRVGDERQLEHITGVLFVPMTGIALEE